MCSARMPRFSISTSSTATLSPHCPASTTSSTFRMRASGTSITDLRRARLLASKPHEGDLMAKKTNESPFQALEEQAYHAFREWPIWLVLRQRELAAHLPASPSAQTTALSQSLDSAVAKPLSPEGA